MMRSFVLFITFTALTGCVVPNKHDKLSEFLTPINDAGKLAPGDKLPVIIHKAEPQFPQELRDRTISGAATVTFIVEPDGSVKIEKIISQTNKIFGAAAVDCVRQWRFKPALKAGAPIRCKMQQTITFDVP